MNFIAALVVTFLLCFPISNIVPFPNKLYEIMFTIGIHWFIFPISYCTITGWGFISSYKNPIRKYRKGKLELDKMKSGKASNCGYKQDSKDPGTKGKKEKKGDKNENLYFLTDKQSKLWN